MEWMVFIVLATGILALVTVVIVVLLQSYPASPKGSSNTRKMLVTNNTNSPTNMRIGNRNITISPKSTTNMVLSYGTVLNIENFSPITISEGGKSKQIIIGERAFYTDLDATPNTRLINTTNQAVGIRFLSSPSGPSDMVTLPPNSKIEGPVIFKGQTWEIVGREEDQNSTLKITQIPKRNIIWNGKKLS